MVWTKTETEKEAVAEAIEVSLVQTSEKKEEEEERFWFFVPLRDLTGQKIVSFGLCFWAPNVSAHLRRLERLLIKAHIFIFIFLMGSKPTFGSNIYEIFFLFLGNKNW